MTENSSTNNARKPSSPAIRRARIESLDAKGRGLATADTGARMTVPYVIPGEFVEAEKSRRTDRLLQILEASPHRVEPQCAHFTVCGGCAWQHIDYTHQLRLKQEAILEWMRASGLTAPTQAPLIDPSPPFGYRNRMDFVWWHDGRFGLREAGKWRSIVDLRECHLIPPEVMTAALEVNRRARELNLPFRDGRGRIPGLRYLVVRRSVFTDQIMLLFVSDPMELPSDLWDGLERVISVFQLVNADLENDASDGEPVHLWGETTYRERLLGRDFLVGPRSFFQPNPVMAARMVEHIRSLLGERKRERLLDLYCGVGFFSSTLADRFEKTLGVECVAEAIDYAKKNCADLPNAHFELLEAERIDALPTDDFDVLLLDPPRSGVHPKTLKWIEHRHFPEIVYVSCNPRLALQEIARLDGLYALSSLRLFDQFPQTAHVEMIAHLTRVIK